MTPGPTAPNGTQGAAISRTSVVRIGNEAPYTFNNNGWITDGATTTDGNALQAGIDRDGADGVDRQRSDKRRAQLHIRIQSAESEHEYRRCASTTVFQQGSVTQMFNNELVSRRLYRLGFTEAARNFQHTNFSGQGLGNDRVRGEVGFFRHEMLTFDPADGGRGRMQMYLWTAPNPDIDGNLDAEVVIHEVTHGTSNRLHGNGADFPQICRAEWAKVGAIFTEIVY